MDDKDWWIIGGLVMAGISIYGLFKMEAAIIITFGLLAFVFIRVGTLN